MNILDIQLKSLANIPVELHGVKSLPKNIRSIAEIGYDKFNEKLGLVLLNKEKVFGEKLPAEVQNFSLIDLACLYGEKDFIEIYIEAFNYFLVEPLKWDYLENTRTLLFEENFEFSNENFEELAQIIKIQHAIVSKEDGDDFNVVSERAKKLKERILTQRKKISEIKSNDGKNSLTFNDLISIVASNANGLNIISVWDLNYYQFNDQFKRMQMIDEYEMNIQALLHGASSEKVELRHWMSPIKD